MSTIRTMRAERSLSLRDVADHLGISHVFMGEIERGIRPLPAKHVEPLAILFGVPPDSIRGRAPERIDLSDLAEADRAKVADLVARLRASRAA